jgi:acyl-CoA reductase-like NAD-dependent aldehyde dehydrogenase
MSDRSPAAGERGAAIASRLEAGHAAVNGMTASDARLPFGGIKGSGYGQGLSRRGIQEFANVHAVVTYGPDGSGRGRADRGRIA